MWDAGSHSSTRNFPLSTIQPTETSEDTVVVADAVPGTAALAKGISVMRAIAGDDRAPAFARLQHSTQLPKGTLHRMLRALIAEGFVRYRESDRTYHLGLNLLSLAYQVLEELDIRDIARDELVRLRDVTGEAVALAVHDDLKAVYIDLVESGLSVGPIDKIGSTSELNSSAVGKAIAAFLPPATQADTLRRLPMTRLTEHTITSRRTLKAHLNTITRQGYALNEQEQVLGIHGIAAPVFNHVGLVVASVCSTIPSYRYEPAKLDANAKAVMDAAARISSRMGYGTTAQGGSA